MAVMVKVDNKNFINNISGEFCSNSKWSWDEAAQIDMNSYY